MFPPILRAFEGHSCT